MTANLNVLVNVSDADVSYQADSSKFRILDLVQDYLIWTKGGAGVADGEDEPTEAELNVAATLIDPDDPVTVEKCLVFDKSEATGTLRRVRGMAENKQYVFGFSFDGDTAIEPQLEAWDDSNHNSVDKNVLGGGGSGAVSMIKGKCTTNDLPGESWAGAPIAGAGDVLLLNDGNGALGDVPSGQDSQELYCNLKIVIPKSFDPPCVEQFVFSVRFTWN